MTPQSADIAPEMLKLYRVTKVKVFFLVLVYVFNFDLFNFWLPFWRRVRINWGKQTFIYQASKDWNNLDNNIKSSESMSFFKAKLKSL